MSLHAPCIMAITLLHYVMCVCVWGGDSIKINTVNKWKAFTVRKSSFFKERTWLFKQAKGRYNSQECSEDRNKVPQRLLWCQNPSVHFLQLIRGKGHGGSSLRKEAQNFLSQPPPPAYTKVLPGQPRDIIFPPYPGSALGPPPIKTCMEHLTHEVSRRHSCKMPESCQLIPCQSIQRSDRSHPWLLRLGHVRIWDKCLRSIVRSSSAPHHKQ